MTTFAEEQNADYERKIAQMKADDIREKNDRRRKNGPAHADTYCWPSEEIAVSRTAGG